MNLLVTAGATREPLDAVRFLSNVSTGATGAALADALAARSCTVALLRGENAVTPRAVRDVEIFSSADDLRDRLQRRLTAGGVDAVIMTAAVADYRPAHRAHGKLPSAPETLTLELVRNPKILPQLKAFSPRPLRVIGFKLTVGADAAARRAAVAAQFAAGGVDAVVHNDLDEIRATATHPFYLYRSAVAVDEASPPSMLAGTAALAEALADFLSA
jgi:phosphopantothenoylcysteine decarboxylase/phosphopantothenate--cysteine ligase